MKIGLGLSLTSMRRRRDTPAFDPDALAYITAVETADGEALEAGVKAAINDFVVGCKADGIWDALKASCILAGARTLNGALVPLAGPAPTNFNFVTDDYDRITGLKGDGSTKDLNSNRADNADPLDDCHASCFVTEESGGGAGSILAYMGVSSGTSIRGLQRVFNLNGVYAYNRNAAGVLKVSDITSTGFLGTSRATSASYTGRGDGADVSVTAASNTPTGQNLTLFSFSGTRYAAARLSFYSIGESIDLAALDARVSALMDTIEDALT